jgi:hypothetical protein
VPLYVAEFQFRENADIFGMASASYTCRSAAVTFGRGALMSLPMLPKALRRARRLRLRLAAKAMTLAVRGRGCEIRKGQEIAERETE